MAASKRRKEKEVKIIIGETPSQKNGPYWREHTDNVTEQILKLPRSKAISYLRVTHGSRGGAKLERQFWKTLANGYMVFVDETNCRIGIVQGFGANRGILGSNKKEFDAAFKKVLKALNV